MLRLREDEWIPFSIPLKKVGGIKCLALGGNGRLFAAGEKAVFEVKGKDEVELFSDSWVGSVHCLLATEDVLFLGTSEGLWAHGKGEWKIRAQGPVLDMISGACGHLWYTDGDVVKIISRSGQIHSIGPRDGLPVHGIRCLAMGSEGSLWVGSSMGAGRLRSGKWSYFASERWLPSDSVRDVIVDERGAAWIATDAGVSRIGWQPMTLEEKCDFFLQGLRKRHLRHGLVASSILDRKGDLSSWRQEASDNDGSWTSYYLASECFRYAVTGSQEARSNAVESFEGLLLLERVTPIRGFPARSAFKKGERIHQSSGEWHESEDGEWMWKGDTSSDELAGSYFAYSVFHDLVANEEEKKEVADLARRIMDYLMANDFNLVDVDGERTRWGVYSPKDLNTPWLAFQKGLNSLSILSHLKATYHMTGDERYQEAYLGLIHEHGYALNTIHQLHPVPRGVSWDHQLSFLSYYPLLKYETCPHLRSIFLQSLENAWKWLEREHVPFWTFVYGWATGHPIDLQKCVWWLQDAPLDLIEWEIRNSLRKDIELHQERDYSRKPIALNPIPLSERRVSKLDKGPYRLDGGARGMVENEGGSFLLCYWIGRYLGFLNEARIGDAEEVVVPEEEREKRPVYEDVQPDVQAAGVKRTSDMVPLSDQENRGDWAPYDAMWDEFDGDVLDEEKWWDHNPEWLGRQPGYFWPGNVEVKDGQLHLTLRKKEVPGMPKDKGYHSFTCAAVKSKGVVLYGYFEVRARPMRSHGSSSFWFYNATPQWWTEIDVFEIGGGAPNWERLMNMNLHVFRTPSSQTHWSVAGKYVADEDLADDFHVYGLEWNQDEILFYFDGVLVRRGPNTHWHQPLTLNFDSETMPEWFGLPQEEDLPSTYSIDYVRAWKRR